MRVYTICHPFQALLSRSTLFAILSNLIRVYTSNHSQPPDQVQGPLSFSGTVWTGSTLFAILNSLIWVYTICHSQSDQGLQYSLIIHSYNKSRSSIMKIYTVCHSQQSDQGLYYLSFSAVWSGSTLFAIHSSLIKVKVHCHPKEQSDQGLHYLPFLAVWSTLFAILSLIRVYTICHSQQSDQGLHYLPFFLSSIIKVYNVCHFKLSY